jgi:hypothetical protein
LKDANGLVEPLARAQSALGNFERSGGFLRKYHVCAILLAPALLVCFSIARGQKSPESGALSAQKTAPADLSGFWMIHPSPSTNAYSSFAFAKEEPPMTAWGEEKFKDAKPVFGPQKTTPKLSNDSVYMCYPPGLPRIYLHPKPIEIVQLPNEVIMMFEYDRIVRHIYTDGRPHAEDLDPPLWMGDSIGKWDGDTLVIDTIGFNDRTWLDRVGHPHSDALHLVERVRRANHDTLTDEITITDPKAYTKPWTVQTTFQLKPNLTLDWEGVCEMEKLADRQ